MLRPWVEPRSIAAPSIAPLSHDDELEVPALPREHPRWVKDAIAVSQRARRLFAQLRPIAIRVLTFWDHQARGVIIAGRRLCVDSSGSYSID